MIGTVTQTSETGRRDRYVVELRHELTAEERAQLEAGAIHIHRDEPGDVTLEVWAAHPLDARTQTIAALDPTNEYRRDPRRLLDFVHDCPRLG